MREVYRFTAVNQDTTCRAVEFGSLTTMAATSRMRRVAAPAGVGKAQT